MLEDAFPTPADAESGATSDGEPSNDGGVGDQSRSDSSSSEEERPPIAKILAHRDTKGQPWDPVPTYYALYNQRKKTFYSSPPTHHGISPYTSYMPTTPHSVAHLAIVAHRAHPAQDRCLVFVDERGLLGHVQATRVAPHVVFDHIVNRNTRVIVVYIDKLWVVRRVRRILVAYRLKLG
jgi:hypothetical protein